MADATEYEEDVLEKARRRAVRRAQDRELAALANLALIRSGISKPAIREEPKKDVKPTPEELEARLRYIIEGADSDAH